MLLQHGKQPVQYTCIRPTAHPGVDRVLIPEAWRQGAPPTAILGNKKYRIDHCQVRNLYITTLNRHMRRDLFVLLVCYLIHNIWLAEVTPSR